MTIQTHIPEARLRPFVKAYIIIESRHELINRVLPSTSLAIAFRFKGQVNYITDNVTKPLPASVITGLRKSVRLINYLPETSTIIVLFKETGATTFFKIPIHKLFEDSVSLDNLVDKQTILNIEEQLAEAKNNHHRIAILEAFLLSRLRNDRIDQLASHAIQRIHSANGIVKIKKLVEDFHISQDVFEKRFRRAVGASPKQYASIIRMNSIIKLKTNDQNLTDVAFSGEYFDQPHFNKEFKRFTGQTPTEFFEASSFW